MTTKPKDIQFAITQDREKQQILTFETLDKNFLQGYLQQLHMCEVCLVVLRFTNAYVKQVV